MLITMSDKEISRADVIRDVCDRCLRRKDAASLLSLTERQAQRLMNQFRLSGIEGLVSKRRGQPSNNRCPENFKLFVLDIIQQHYVDFGPTLATEKLHEVHGVDVSRETVRSWMISSGLWVPHAQRKPRVYQPRQRRDCLGELI